MTRLVPLLLSLGLIAIVLRMRHHPPPPARYFESEDGVEPADPYMEGLIRG